MTQRKMKTENSLLEISTLQAGYGEVTALWNISLNVGYNEIIGLLGSNGAGKSTLMNVISGLIPTMKGKILFEGVDITASTPKERVKKGITQIPEGRLLFSGLTVKQNLMLGAFTRNATKKIEEDLEIVFDLFPRLEERKQQMAGTLSGGEQQMCAIGRGLMANPKLLLIDELSLGLAPILVDQIMDALARAYRERNLSIILVEQDVHLGLMISNRAYVIETGHIVKEEKSDILAQDPEIRRAYLGL
jgi:branched-chain amino acid transport system ATP-binding protein